MHHGCVKRRDALKILGTTVAGASLAVAAASRESDTASADRGSPSPMTTTRMPVVYLPHGGGPWPFVELPIFAADEIAGLAGFLKRYPEKLPSTPRALLVISAHWEESEPTVMTSAQPPMLYDYYGFPPESYEITWPAPGAPELAARTHALLASAGFSPKRDDERGFDHGTFIPLKVMFPDARVPTLQVSMLRDLDPQRHIALGRALAPLRDEGVLIVGSGMSYHNLRGLMARTGRADSESFDAWLQKAATADGETRRRQLQSWVDAPGARKAHPREEHLLPLMVVAGAAGDDGASLPYSGLFGGARITAIAYG
jgi:aromatic ring-opening dioxygenase catalytic subunit (LigB family)